MQFAITPKGIGKQVGMRMYNQIHNDLAPSEFLVDVWSKGDVLAADGVSLLSKRYALTVSDARERKKKEENQKAMSKFVAYRDSSIEVTDGQLTAYKAALRSAFNTADVAIKAINSGNDSDDIKSIEDFPVELPELS